MRKRGMLGAMMGAMALGNLMGGNSVGVSSGNVLGFRGWPGNAKAKAKKKRKAKIHELRRLEIIRIRNHRASKALGYYRGVGVHA